MRAAWLGVIGAVVAAIIGALVGNSGNLSVVLPGSPTQTATVIAGGPTVTLTSTATATETVTASVNSTSSSTVEANSVALTAQDIIDQRGGAVWEVRDAAKLKGEPYDHTLFACGNAQGGIGLNCVQDQSTISVEVSTGAHATAFTALLGLGDLSSGDCRVRTQVFVDSRPQPSRTIGATDFVPVRIPITGALRLKFEATFLSGTGCRLEWGGASFIEAQ